MVKNVKSSLILFGLLLSGQLFNAMTILAAEGAKKDTLLIPMNRKNYAHIKQIMERHPKPTYVGVDLSWHMDRAIEYMANVVDRRNKYIPYYRNCVYFGPAKLAHAQWDVPHCVGRLLDAMMMWEETFGRRVKDEQVVKNLRALLHESISDKDHLAHFPPYCKETEEVDWHSQRETLLALTGLYKMRADQESLVLAEQLVKGYDKFSSKPGFPIDPMWSGRFIEALLDFHRLTDNPLALEMAKQFADDFYYKFFDDKGTFPRPGNNQSTLQAIGELIEFGYYTNQSRYIHKMKRIIDMGLWEARSKFGLIFENMGPRGETNCCGDLIKAEIMLGLNGYPGYFDDAERILRNHLLASQYLDPTIGTGPTAKEAGVKDNENEVYTNASVRALGGFAFTLPNDLIDPTISAAVDVPVDMVGGVMHGLIAVWRHIVTQNEQGLWVNFLLSKKTPDLEIRSYIPVEGRVELKVKRPENIFVRIPKYVKLENLRLSVNGKEFPKRMFGLYLLIPKQSYAFDVLIQFDQEVKVEEETICDVTYRVVWLGDTVWNITPAGQQVPLYYPARLALYGLTPDNLAPSNKN